MKLTQAEKVDKNMLSLRFNNGLNSNAYTEKLRARKTYFLSLFYIMRSKYRETF